MPLRRLAARLRGAAGTRLGRLRRRARTARRRMRGRRGRRFLRRIERGTHNRRVDRLFAPLPLASLAARGVETGELALSQEDYLRLLEAPCLARFRDLGFAHTKPLEYLASLQALRPRPGEVLLDAAGGASGEYLLAARHRLGDGVVLRLHDAVAADAALAGRVQPVGGSLEALELPDGSVDCIACHHAFEHFRGDLDRRFLAEALRVLRPGGRLAIVPLFVSPRYGEIWNVVPRGRYDRRARPVWDPSASFAGWGPYEGFARVYDPIALEERVLRPLGAHRPRVLDVTLDGEPVPDLAHNRHQPRVNGAMKLLLAERSGAGRSRLPVPGRRRFR